MAAVVKRPPRRFNDVEGLPPLRSRVFPPSPKGRRDTAPSRSNRGKAISLINAALVAHFKETGASLRAPSASKRFLFPPPPTRYHRYLNSQPLLPRCLSFIFLG